ncbi:hypothetical protein [Streptococcus ferus]|uniref:hypothetical protein n=1 Tax=Streptococcus ferus TaxID=1345 RepID=UPI002352527C|nr:hypothetical protein [Streptococcus ferus]
MTKLELIYDNICHLSMLYVRLAENKILLSSSKVGFYLEGEITLSDTVPCLVLREHHLFEEITKNYYPAVDELIDVLAELNDNIVRYVNVVSDLESAIF